jgi:hypothetical protein
MDCIAQYMTCQSLADSGHPGAASASVNRHFATEEAFTVASISTRIAVIKNFWHHVRLVRRRTDPRVRAQHVAGLLAAK